MVDADGLVEALKRAGTGRGDQVGLVLHPAAGVAAAWPGGGSWFSAGTGIAAAVAALRHAEQAVGPRWVMWSNQAAVTLAEADVRLRAAWDLSAVHRLLFGAWAAEPAVVWAAANGLALDTVPSSAPPDLFSAAEDDGGDPADPVRPDGHLRPEWTTGGWAAGGPQRLGRWAGLAVRTAGLQMQRLRSLPDHPLAVVTARSESAAELLCAEMTVEGLPMDRAVAEDIIAGFVGPRPASEAEAAALMRARDALVLRHVPPGVQVDLRSSAQVRDLLSRLGIEVADTRAGRLRAVQDRHPVVPAFMAWRKAERVATTYGYAWLDRHVGPDGRLRGTWTGSDGAAGRMTASAGLHNMPAELRPAVVAGAGRVFVRADLGQVEPRVLAAVSGDGALAGTAMEDDLYLPVAAQLGVDRATAKVAVLGAMYGQTTGHGAQALRRLVSAYPVAMAYLERAARAAEAGRDLRTHGGRLVRMVRPAPGEPPAAAAARGRYGRNAVVQGAAAELFKTWAATVRARGQDLDARIVLCLHDELLVHAPAAHGGRVAEMVGECLHEAVRRWAPGTSVRFTAEVAVIDRWSEAKEAPAPTR